MLRIDACFRFKKTFCEGYAKSKEEKEFFLLAAAFFYAQ